MVMLQAQSLRRSTMSSLGQSGQVGDLKIQASFGQKGVSCTTTTGSNGNKLRQGFIQPPSSQPCQFTADFVSEVFTVDCGTYYSFEYTGNANPADVVFTWDFGADSAPQISNEANPMDIGYSVIGQKIVRLTVSDGDCETSSVLTLDVTDTAFSVELLGLTDAGCFGDENGTVTLNAVGGVEPIGYKWADGRTTAMIDNLAAGSYDYTVTDSDGCEYTNSVTIEGPTEAGALTSSITDAKCTNTADGAIDITVLNLGTDLTFDWSNGDTSEDISGVNPGDYSVVVIDENGCKATATFLVQNDCEPDKLPDIITPNGDGVNATWVIPDIDKYPNNKVQIFNRWGSLIYTKEAYTNDWDATIDGEELPAGAYYYVLDYNNGESQRACGSITVIR